MIELVPERDFLEEKVESDNAVVSFTLDASIISGDIGTQTLSMEFPLTETVTAIKAKLVAMGAKRIPSNKMTVYSDIVGYLKERHSFAFYNFTGSQVLQLGERKRAGVRFRADHTVLPRRPSKQPKGIEKEPAVPTTTTTTTSSVINPNQLKLPAGLSVPAGGFPNLLSGNSILGSMPGAGGVPANPLSQLGGVGQLLGPKAGLPALPGMQGLGLGGGLAKAGLPSLPGLPPIGADPKAAAMALMNLKPPTATLAPFSIGGTKGGAPPPLTMPALSNVPHDGGGASMSKAGGIGGPMGTMNMPLLGKSGAPMM